MNITAIYSSPRKTGNSSTMVNKFLEKFQNDDIKKFYLTDMRISGCKACYVCKSDVLNRCVLDDDMDEVYSSIEMSKLIVIGSPLYWWNISSYLKVVVDRLYPYVGTNKLAGKLIVLMVSGYSPIPNSGYDLIDSTFKEICAYLNLRYCIYVASADDERPVSKNAEVLNAIHCMSLEL